MLCWNSIKLLKIYGDGVMLQGIEVVLWSGVCNWDYIYSISKAESVFAFRQGMKKGILKSGGSLNQKSVLLGHTNISSEINQYTSPGFEQFTFQYHAPTWVRTY